MIIKTDGIPYPIPNQGLSALSRQVEIFFNLIPLKRLYWGPSNPPVENEWQYGWNTVDGRKWKNGVRLGDNGSFYITYNTNDEFVEGLAVAHVAVRLAIEELVKIGLKSLEIDF